MKGCLQPRAALQPVVCAPVWILPRIEFEQGAIIGCSTPRILACPGESCRYLLEQEMTVQIPFCCGTQVEAGTPYIECRPPWPLRNL